MSEDEKVTNTEKTTTSSTAKSSGSKSSSTKKKTETSVKTAKKTRPAPRRPARKRTYTFEQWAQRRGVPSHHKGGLRAYVPNVNKSRTLEEWDACFKDY